MVEIIDVTEVDFQQKVIEASRQKTVVVDFWAPWCAPCRMLGPILERAVSEAGTDITLAKVNVDENPSLAMQWGVQGIPAVKIFRDGRVINEFVGALPEEQVRRILKQSSPSKADALVAQGDAALRNLDVSTAETLYRQALAEDPNCETAALRLAALLMERGNTDEAEKMLSSIKADSPLYDAAQALRSRMEFAKECTKHGGAEAARKKFEANPNDADAAYAWGCCLAAKEQYRDALEVFLSILTNDKNYEAAREAMVKIFSIVGERSELADEYRQKMAMILY